MIFNLCFLILNKKNFWKYRKSTFFFFFFETKQKFQRGPISMQIENQVAVSRDTIMYSVYANKTSSDLSTDPWPFFCSSLAFKDSWRRNGKYISVRPLCALFQYLRTIGSIKTRSYKDFFIVLFFSFERVKCQAKFHRSAYWRCYS